MKNLLLFTVLLALTLTSTAQTVTDIDGNIYNTVTIGTQVWMKENLMTTKYNDGIPIPLVTNDTSWFNLRTPGYCWYNNDLATYGDTFGALYNGYTVNTGKLCPTDWHVPTDEEWSTMENFLMANGYNYDGTIDTDNDRNSNNKIAKSLADTTTWCASTDTGNVGNTDYPAWRNKTGFSALPGGMRYHDGSYSAMGAGGFWYCATDSISDHVLLRSIMCDYSNVGRGECIGDPGAQNTCKGSGYSVRCLMGNNPSSLYSLIAEDLALYPNPANEKLYLNNSYYTNSIIMIFDLQGKQVLIKQIDSDPIDISNIRKGIYIVKLVCSENVLISKFIKE